MKIKVLLGLGDMHKKILWQNKISIPEQYLLY